MEGIPPAPAQRLSTHLTALGALFCGLARLCIDVHAVILPGEVGDVVEGTLVMLMLALIILNQRSWARCRAGAIEATRAAALMQMELLVDQTISATTHELARRLHS